MWGKIAKADTMKALLQAAESTIQFLQTSSSQQHFYNNFGTKKQAQDDEICLKKNQALILINTDVIEVSLRKNQCSETG